MKQLRFHIKEYAMLGEFNLFKRLWAWFWCYRPGGTHLSSYLYYTSKEYREVERREEEEIE
jgi:hypothetical protein